MHSTVTWKNQADKGWEKWAYTNFTQLLFVCAIACAASLCVAIVARIFVSPGGYAKDVIDALGLLKNLVRLATTRTIDPPLSAETRSSSPTLTLNSDPTPAKPPPSVEDLRKSYQQAAFSLPASYAYSAFELRTGRVHISHIKYLVDTVERIREGLTCGVVRLGVRTQLDQRRTHEGDAPVGFSDDHFPVDELELFAVLDAPSHSCSDAIEEGITALQDAIGICYGIKATSGVHQPHPQSSADMNTKEESSHSKHPTSHAKRSASMSQVCLSNLRTKRALLAEARVALQEALDSVDRGINHAYMPRSASDSRPGTPRQILGTFKAAAQRSLRKSLYARSLFHTSSEILDALDGIIDVLIRHMNNSLRIFLPRPSWLWLGLSPRASVLERTRKRSNTDQNTTCQDNSRSDANNLGGTGGLSAQEVTTKLTRDNVAAESVVTLRVEDETLPEPVTSSKLPAPLRKGLDEWWYSHWTTRITWTSVQQGVYHLRDLPQWVLETLWNQAKVLASREKMSRLLRRIKHSKHVQHGVKNAVGITLLAVPGFLPLGSPGRNYFESERGFWAIISFLYVLEPNTALTWRVGMMRLCGTVIGAVYAYTAWVICRENPYGLVAAVTASEIMLTRLVRSSTPGVGVVASVTIPPILFTPYLGLPHSSVIGLAAVRGLQISIGIVAAILVNHFLFPRHCRVMFLSGMAQVLANLTQSFLYTINRTPNEAARAGREMLEKKLGDMISEENLLLKQMENEISLVTKPTNLYQQGMEAVQRIAELMSELRRIRENVYQGEATRQVLQHRQHTVSCILIALFICEHAFRSHRPLPQMLPSPRKLPEAPEETLQVMSMGYIGENEVYDEMADALEELIIVSRELFGTNTWLPNEPCDAVGSFARAQAWSGVEIPGTQSRGLDVV